MPGIWFEKYICGCRWGYRWSNIDQELIIVEVGDGSLFTLPSFENYVIKGFENNLPPSTSQGLLLPHLCFPCWCLFPQPGGALTGIPGPCGSRAHHWLPSILSRESSWLSSASERPALDWVMSAVAPFVSLCVCELLGIRMEISRNYGPGNSLEGVGLTVGWPWNLASMGMYWRKERLELGDQTGYCWIQQIFTGHLLRVWPWVRCWGCREKWNVRDGKPCKGDGEVGKAGSRHWVDWAWSGRDCPFLLSHPPDSLQPCKVLSNSQGPLHTLPPPQEAFSDPPLNSIAICMSFLP